MQVQTATLDLHHLVQTTRLIFTLRPAGEEGSQQQTQLRTEQRVRPNPREAPAPAGSLTEGVARQTVTPGPERDGN